MALPGPAHGSVALHKGKAAASRFLALPPALGARPEVSKLTRCSVQEVPGHKPKCGTGEGRASPFSSTIQLASVLITTKMVKLRVFEALKVCTVLPWRTSS